jgi:hypothetical protein
MAKKEYNYAIKHPKYGFLTSSGYDRWFVFRIRHKSKSEVLKYAFTSQPEKVYAQIGSCNKALRRLQYVGEVSSSGHQLEGVNCPEIWKDLYVEKWEQTVADVQFDNNPAGVRWLTLNTRRKTVCSSCGYTVQKDEKYLEINPYGRGNRAILCPFCLTGKWNSEAESALTQMGEERVKHVREYLFLKNL